MPTVVYCHGFLSSPQSTKAQFVKHWLTSNRPSWRYLCPELSAYPHQAKATLTQIANTLRHQQETFYCIGSSLGGYWATWITEQYGVKSVLVNPAVAPHTRFTRWIDQPLKSYYSDQQYQLKQSDLDELRKNDHTIIRNKGLYFVLLQTGDETLDYRDAKARYRGCRMVIEEGGNHSFIDFEGHLLEITNFFEEGINSRT